jgi:hypothetical protein
MIGFVSAISASLAIIILVSLASLIAYVQSILPSYGLVKISDDKYRYYMDGQFVKPALIEDIVTQAYNLGISDRITSYQNGCLYGFNLNQEAADQISTFNYITMNQFFQDSVPVGSILALLDESKINACFVDINLRTSQAK